MYFDQSDYDIRFEWGLSGLQELVPVSDVIIVDVLSFTTCVDIVVGNGGFVLPYRGELDALPDFAESMGALFASKKRQKEAAYSLSPSSLVEIPKGTRLVLPSPNGSTLSLATGGVYTLAGCLRNARAVGKKANLPGKLINVIAAGERWNDSSLRPAIQDLIGAGAIITHMKGSRSPEAELAVAAFTQVKSNILETLLRCGSGKELVGRGFEEDVHLAGQLNVSSSAPVLVDGVYG